MFKFRHLDKGTSVEKVCKKFENWFNKKGLLTRMIIWGFIPFSTLPTSYLEYKKEGFCTGWVLLVVYLVIEFDKIIMAAIIFAIIKGYVKL